MGWLLALSLACTLVSALLFLPALLGPPRRPAAWTATGQNNVAVSDN
jgi:hypothetical protein